MVMVIQKLFQLWKMIKVQKYPSKSMNVLFTARKGLGNIFKRKKKDVKELGGEGRLTDAEIDQIQILAFYTKTLGTLIK